jgi:hypothetical protein
MSTKIMLEVARHSTAKGNAKLVLLLLASYAHPDGTHAEMSLSTIAREAGISRRQVNTIVHFLAETGHVTLASSAGSHGTNRYAIVRPWLKQGNHFPSATTSPGAITALLVQPLPTIDKENKNLKKQSCAMAALGQSLPQALGQSLPQALGQSLPQQTEAKPGKPRSIEVTEKAAHLVSTWVSPAFSEVLQGKDPAPIPEPVSTPVVAAEVPPPSRRPRSVSFDERRFFLGEPCQDNPTHRYGDTGDTVRSLKTQRCENCRLAAKKAASQPPP